ncbi:MAG TPA: hypothetical protein VFG75_09195 [Gaiella sp.]|nr:hypothetical protein [Gaiella sp.]
MSEDLGEAIDRLSEQVGALQAEVRALDRRSALPPPAKPQDPLPPGAFAWLGEVEAPVRRRPQLPRVVLEGLFLAAVAAAAAIAELDAVAIVGVMVGAWVLVALIEWAASRAEREPTIPVYAAGPPEAPRADPAWYAPPVEHTLLDSTGDPVTAVTRLPPVTPGDDPEATVEQRPAV